MYVCIDVYRTNEVDEINAIFDVLSFLNYRQPNSKKEVVEK